MERNYPSDVSDAEWALLEPSIIDPTALREHQRVTLKKTATPSAATS